MKSRFTTQDCDGTAQQSSKTIVTLTRGKHVDTQRSLSFTFGSFLFAPTPSHFSGFPFLSLSLSLSQTKDQNL